MRQMSSDALRIHKLVKSHHYCLKQLLLILDVDTSPARISAGALPSGRDSKTAIRYFETLLKGRGELS